MRTLSFMGDRNHSSHHNNRDSSHRNKTTALIHMGPHKTGSSSLQLLTDTFMNELKEDGYHLPFDWARKYMNGGGWCNQENFIKSQCKIVESQVTRMLPPSCSCSNRWQV